MKLEPGSHHSFLIRLHSHHKEPDGLFVHPGAPGRIPAEPRHWALSNTAGSSAANLSRAVLHSNAAGFSNIRIASTRDSLQDAAIVAGPSEETDDVVRTRTQSSPCTAAETSP